MPEQTSTIQSVAELKRIIETARRMAEELSACMNAQAERFPTEKWHQPRTIALSATAGMLRVQEETLEGAFRTPPTPACHRKGSPETYRGTRTPGGEPAVEVSREDGRVLELPAAPRIHRGQPQGFDWGNDSPETRHLAMALLHDTGACEITRGRVVEAFLHEVAARLPADGWTLSENQVWEWASDHPGV